MELFLYFTRRLPKQCLSSYFTSACPCHKELEYVPLILVENERTAELEGGWSGKKQE